MTQFQYIALWLVGINVFTFLIYGLDKYYARRGYWRIPENILLLSALVGGSPAAYIAQRFFRHKIHKRNFRICFWLVIVIQLTVLILYYANFFNGFISR